MTFVSSGIVNFIWTHYIFHLLEQLYQSEQNSYLFCPKKTYFFYFTHSFLQNVHISLSILLSILFK